eukprot:scaffold1449_cov244-Pinguiococcus_pyrenoidosus.AAC.7
MHLRVDLHSCRRRGVEAGTQDRGRQKRRAQHCLVARHRPSQGERQESSSGQRREHLVPPVAPQQRAAR